MLNAFFSGNLPIALNPSKQNHKRSFGSHVGVRHRSVEESSSLVGLFERSHRYGRWAPVSREPQPPISLIYPRCPANHNHSIAPLDSWFRVTPASATPSRNFAVRVDPGLLPCASHLNRYTQYYTLLAKSKYGLNFNHLEGLYEMGESKL